VLLGLESNGLHTNGYSLARRIVSDRLKLRADDAFPGGGGSVADVLLRVHRSYLGALGPVLDRIHAMAHITGGGLEGNVNRVLPAGLDAVIDTATWTVPREFVVLAEAGEVARGEMFRAFNMGVGMVIITTPDDAGAVTDSARSAGVRCWRLGKVGPGSGRVILN
jgi:phosphoribosylformylglycinamidine cyclo-ligase